jgi:MoxR-like ATPase
MDGVTYPMAAPFMVLATQNPVEQEGTYRLPEAQLDRFLFKIEVTYPTVDQELLILQQAHERKGQQPVAEITPVLSAEQMDEYRRKVKEIHVDAALLRYIAQLVSRTRSDASLYLGASPRASLAIMNGAKALAAIRGRDFVTPEDIRQVALPVLRHRIILTPEKEMEGGRPDEVIGQIIQALEVPR